LDLLDDRLDGDIVGSPPYNGSSEVSRQMTDKRSQATTEEGEPRRRTSWLVIGVRYVLPAAVVLGGLIVMALGSEADLEGGASIVSAGLAIYAMNWLYRASVGGDLVRDEEEAARDYLDLHGRWPDEAPSAQPE
jgi:hypothetical protein